MTAPEAALPHAIRTARTERALTQAELAARIGVSQGTISFWESGVEMPRVEHLVALTVELPEIIDSFSGRERELLQRMVRIERELFAGRCACKGCACQST
jgi:transcriptional regulator with XRE-family HTH domain